jgi:predicted nucleotidyltransferase
MDGWRVSREFALALADDLDERCLGVALFGSWARGESHEDSDIDLLLIARDLPADPIGRARRVRRAVLTRIEPVSILARAPEEFEADVTPLHLDLALDASVLWERDSYLTDKLAILRDRIGEAGLWRSSDLFWHWRRAPRMANWGIYWDRVRV